MDHDVKKMPEVGWTNEKGDNVLLKFVPTFKNKAMGGKRICVYPQDLQVITGKGERYCRKVIQAVKVRNGKEKHQPVTFEEVGNYLKLPGERIFRIINNIPMEGV